MANKRLLFYINAIHQGGAERVMLQLCQRFLEHGYEPLLVTSFVDSWEYPVPEGVERISLEQQEADQGRLKRNISRIRALRRLIKEREPALVISFMAEPNYRALIAARGLDTKTLISVRNDPAREYGGRLGRLLGQKLLPLADGCVFQTRQARDWFPKKLRDKSRIIMNQVDERFFSVPEGEGSCILTAGRLTEQKDQAMLIRAYARLLPEERLVICGEGPLRSQLQELIAGLGLTDKIELAGDMTDMPKVLEGAKLFVLPSAFEGMPNALLEAMAAGRCCISTDCPCGGPEMIIDSGVDGLLTPVGDEAALAKAMDSCLQDSGLRRSMAKAARKKAESFRPEAVFAQWLAYVEELIN